MEWLISNMALPELLAVLRREMGISRLYREDYKVKSKKHSEDGMKT